MQALPVALDFAKLAFEMGKLLLQHHDQLRHSFILQNLNYCIPKLTHLQHILNTIYVDGNGVVLNELDEYFLLELKCLVKEVSVPEALRNDDVKLFSQRIMQILNGCPAEVADQIIQEFKTDIHRSNLYKTINFRHLNWVEIPEDQLNTAALKDDYKPETEHLKLKKMLKYGAIIYYTNKLKSKCPGSYIYQTDDDDPEERIVVQRLDCQEGTGKRVFKVKKDTQLNEFGKYFGNPNPDTTHIMFKHNGQPFVLFNDLSLAPKVSEIFACKDLPPSKELSAILG